MPSITAAVLPPTGGAGAPADGPAVFEETVIGTSFWRTYQPRILSQNMVFTIILS
jgi:hypothetical protein